MIHNNTKNQNLSSKLSSKVTATHDGCQSLAAIMDLYNLTDMLPVGFAKNTSLKLIFDLNFNSCVSYLYFKPDRRASGLPVLWPSTHCEKYNGAAAI